MSTRQFPPRFTRAIPSIVDPVPTRSEQLPAGEIPADFFPRPAPPQRRGPRVSAERDDGTPTTSATATLLTTCAADPRGGPLSRWAIRLLARLS